jgi:hypothetical protein
MKPIAATMAINLRMVVLFGRSFSVRAVGRDCRSPPGPSRFISDFISPRKRKNGKSAYKSVA